MADWDDIRIFLEVARCNRLVDAAKRLGLDHSTVSRRIRRFEQQLATQLFEREQQGYMLTQAGYQLLQHAEEMEQSALNALEEVGGQNRQLFGQVRLGTTEGFGHFVITPQLAHFCKRYPAITVDLMPLPRIVNLARHEADLAITIERPEHASLVVSKLCDYRLRLYATPEYLESQPAIRQVKDLKQHSLIGYVNDLLFSNELNYLETIVPNAFHCFRSTSVISQYTAACESLGPAILPCFLADRDARLVPLLEDQIDIVRSFWITAPVDRRRLARITALWDYLKTTMEANRTFLMGEGENMCYPDAL